MLATKIAGLWSEDEDMILGALDQAIQGPKSARLAFDIRSSSAQHSSLAESSVGIVASATVVDFGLSF